MPAYAVAKKYNWPYSSVKKQVQKINKCEMAAGRRGKLTPEDEAMGGQLCANKSLPVTQKTPKRPPRRPQEAPGGPMRPQEAPGGPRRLQEAPGGPRRPQEAFWKFIFSYLGTRGIASPLVCTNRSGRRNQYRQTRREPWG